MHERTQPIDDNVASDSIPQLLKELRDETTVLLRQEVTLAKTELNEKVSTVTSNLTQIIAGALVAYAGVVILFLALSVGLYAIFVSIDMAHLTAGWLAPLLVGGILTGVGVGLTKKAMSTLQNISAVPERTVETVKDNAKWAKEKVTA